jgi:hypothetical protein
MRMLERSLLMQNQQYGPLVLLSIDIVPTRPANNRVIGTDFTYTDPSTLQPGQKAPFDMLVLEGSMPLYLVAYYVSVDYSNFNLR